MTNFVRKLIPLAMALFATGCWITTTSTAFVSPTTGFARPTRVSTEAGRQLCGTRQPQERIGQATTLGLGRARRTSEVLMNAGSQSGSKQPASAVAASATAAIVALAGASSMPLPAIAIPDVSQAIVGTFQGLTDGPIVLFIPIFFGFAVASSIAGFIYYFSTPRELDD